MNIRLFANIPTSGSWVLNTIVVYYLDIANNTPVGPNGGTYEKLNLYWNYTNSNEGYYSIGSIGAMKNASIPVSLYITSQTDVATLDAQLSYVLNGQPYSVSRSLSLLSPGYVNITNTGTTQLPDVATPGSVVSLTGTLLNTGSISASAVTLITHSVSGVSVLGENSTFLGSIGTYSPTAFTVSVTLSRSIKPGTYEIPITLEYINNLNQKENELIDMPLVVSSGNSTSTAFSSNPYANAAKYRKSSGALLYVILAVVLKYNSVEPFSGTRNCVLYS